MKQENYKDRIKAKHRKRAAARLAASFIVFLGLIVSAMYILFFAGFFDVRYIEIETSDAVPEATIKSVADEWLNKTWLGISHRRNITIFRPNHIEDMIESAFPRVRSASVNKISRHSLRIRIIEREALGIWCIIDADKCFYFDSNGLAFAEVAKSSGYLFANVNDNRSRNITLGGYVEGKEWIDNLFYVKRALQFGGIGMLRFEIDKDSKDEFSVKTSEGWRILFNNETDVRRQSESLIQFLKEKISAEERANLEYVDLRIDDRIYYK